jgi:hypothetical protein
MEGALEIKEPGYFREGVLRARSKRCPRNTRRPRRLSRWSFRPLPARMHGGMYLQTPWNPRRVYHSGMRRRRSLKQGDKLELTWQWGIPSRRYDLGNPTQNKVQETNTTWKYKHVKGHQDEHSRPYDSLDRMSRLNVLMDGAERLLG